MNLLTNINMNTKIVWMMASALVFTACEKEGDKVWNGEICLSSSVNNLSVTKAFGLDEKLREGQTVSFWVDDAKDPLGTVSKENLYLNHILTTGPGSSLSGSTPMFYPETGNKVDIYAIYPSITGADAAFPTTVSHSVKADQTSEADYAASDLLYAAKKGVEPTSAVIPVSFNHILSKLEVILKAGSGAPSLTNAVVTLEGLKLKAEFTPEKNTDLSKSRVTLVQADNDPAAIQIGNSMAEKNEAIVVPQTWTADVASNKAFIKIRLENGGELTYVPSADIIFERGKKYTYTVTANLTELKVSTSIVDWGDGGTVNDANANMP